MISSNSSFVGPLPNVNVPVRCFQSSNDKWYSSRAMNTSSATLLHVARILEKLA